MTLREIPGTKGFLVSTSGVVYDPEGKTRNTYRQLDGYVTASVMTTDGKWITYGVHRLVALAHLPPSENPERTQVNHRDGDVTNNNAENLEWVTVRENNIHSAIFRTSEYPTLIATKGIVNLGAFSSVWEASKELGLNHLDIWDSVKDAKEINGIIFTHRPFDGKIPLEFRKRYDRDIFQKPIKMLDLDTGEETEYPNIAAAAKAHKTTTDHIRDRLPFKAGIRLFRRRFRVGFVGEPYKEATPEELREARLRGPRPVFAYNTQTKRWLITASAKEFITLTKLSKKAVTSTLAKGVLREIDSWVVVYHNPENLEKLKAFVGSPVPIEVV